MDPKRRLGFVSGLQTEGFKRNTMDGKDKRNTTSDKYNNLVLDYTKAKMLHNLAT